MSIIITTISLHVHIKDISDIFMKLILCYRKSVVKYGVKIDNPEPVGLEE